MKLPIGVELDGSVYTDVNIKRAESLVIAKTTEEAGRGNPYSAILEWNAGITESLSGNDGTVEGADIRRALRFMPFESSFALACHGMAETKKDDSISGVYPCPKCGSLVKAERGENDGVPFDDTDHLYALDVETLDDPKEGIALTLQYPVELKKRDSGEVIETIESFVMDWPTLDQCIRAHQKCPDAEMRMQFALYSSALRTVNNKPVDGTWKATYGTRFFEKMDAVDTASLNDIMKRYSINVSRERVCMKCKTHFDAPIDLNGFFASGLGKKAQHRDPASRGQ
jgi:hypothetical protein